MNGPSILESILRSENLSVKFQPIYRVGVRGVELYGFEGLTRGPRDTNMEYPTVLFEYARRKKCESLLDVACVHRILSQVCLLPARSLVSVNVHASTLSRNDEFAQVLSRIAEKNDVDMARLIVEVIEHGTPWSTSAFHRELDDLRDLGVRVALDDVGIGDSSIRMLVECRPDLLKIDRYFARGCAEDRYRQAAIGALVHLARGCGADVLCEGIETRDDLEAVMSLGVDLFQGFYFSAAVEAAEAARMAGVTSPLARWTGQAVPRIS